MPDRILFYDGALKAVNPWDPDDTPEAWTWLSGGPPDVVQVDMLTKVAWPYRAIQLLAETISSIPFALIYSRTGKEFDTSRDWQNRAGFWSDPTRIIWLAAASLNATGKAYFHKQRNGTKLADLRYWLYSSVEPKIDEAQGLQHFVRRVNGKLMEFPVEDVLHFWLPDYNVEIGPPFSYPGKAMFAAAGVLYNLDEYISAFWKRGAIKPFVVGVKGNPPPAEREKLDTWLKSVWIGIKNAFTPKIINADQLTFMSIGEGLDSLRDTELTTQEREAIATAAGIPQTMLFSQAANYATAMEDSRNFLDKTCLPQFQFICEEMNRQIFTPLGLRMVDRAESMDEFKADEHAQAESLSLYAQAGMPLSIAAEMLGLELPTDIEYGDLDIAVPAPGILPFSPRPVQDELRRWQRKSLHSLGNGNGANVTFTSQIIPVEIAAKVSDQLITCTDVASVRTVFENTTLNTQPRRDAAEVLEGIRLALEGLRQ